MTMNQHALVQEFLRNGGSIRHFEAGVRGDDEAVIDDLARHNVIVKRIHGNRIAVQINGGRFQTMRWPAIVKLRDKIRQQHGLEPIRRPSP